MKTLPKIYTLSNYQEVENILLVGCGGTGGYLASNLARFISVINEQLIKKDEEPVKLFFADGDIVEEKNLSRQHFIAQDISKNKAVTLASRYSAAFGIEIGVVPKDIESLDDIDFLIDERRDMNRSDLIIGCVDNHASRRLINRWFKGERNTNEDGFSYRGLFWIDSGNEESSGQVICGYNPSTRGSFKSRKINLEKSKITSGEFSLPSVIDLYSDISKDESGFNSSLSCAERSISAPQNMQTNVTAATLIMNFAQKLILGQDLRSHGVEFSIDNVFSTKLNTLDNLQKVNLERRKFWETN